MTPRRRQDGYNEIRVPRPSRGERDSLVPDWWDMNGTAMFVVELTPAGLPIGAAETAGSAGEHLDGYPPF